MIAKTIAARLQSLLADEKDVKVVAELQDRLAHPLPDSGTLVVVVEQGTTDMERAVQAEYIMQQIEVHILAVKSRDVSSTDRASLIKDRIVNDLNGFSDANASVLDTVLTSVGYPAPPAQSAAYVVLGFRALARIK